MPDEIETAVAAYYRDRPAPSAERDRADLASLFVADENWESLYRQPDPHAAAAELDVALQFALYDERRQAAIEAGLHKEETR